MRKMMIAAGAAALLATVSLASAADVTGSITAVDATAATVTLDNGSTYTLPANADKSAWKVGDKVKITYDTANGKMTATAVAKAAM
jgi:Cu/Ag efflux protein CusF